LFVRQFASICYTLVVPDVPDVLDDGHFAFFAIDCRHPNSVIKAATL